MMGFHFSHLLLYDQFLKAKSVRSQEAVVSEIITHATAIIRLAIDTMDERTRHLSDHIYHMITFAAVIICRITGAPEHYPEIAYKAEELDTMISSLVQWLQSIGLPCHAAHTFGTIIAQVQQKARPQVDANTSSPVQTGDILPDEFTRFYFPEFLGVGATPNGSWDLAPNFSFFSQDYPLPDGID